jgi:flagellar hook protein FlgE
MGLSNSMNTALSGLNASQTILDVAGNNIANVNTPGFKKSSVSFKTQLSQTLTAGSSPSNSTGGTNPIQIGLGVSTGSISKDMSTGSTKTTGKNSDVAINGSGFFVLKDSSGNISYSRDGNFGLNLEQNLINSSGQYVLGYPVDSNYKIISSTPTFINIPLGELSVAQATENAVFKGNLSADKNAIVGKTAGYATSQQLIDMSTGTPATANTLLANLATADNPTVSIMAVGDTITMNIQKGGADITSKSFTVTNAATAAADSGTTLGEFLEYLQGNLAVDTTSAQTTPAGVTINNGVITVTGNLGDANVPTVELSSNNSSITTPFLFETTTPADVGTSTSTTFRAYDSLGNAIQVRLSFVLIDGGTTNNTWQFYAESTDDTDVSKFLGTGTVTFNTDGKMVDSTGTTISINRAGTGAADPVTINLDFSSLRGLSEEGTGTNTTNKSSVTMDTQDGAAPGTLNGYSIAADGKIIGTFSNNLSRTLGQIVIADFANPEGLIAKADNTYIPGPNSGEAAITTPGASGTGSLIGGALELSNVDITEEFIDMVSASTAFSASGKVITTAQTLLQELMNIVR